MPRLNGYLRGQSIGIVDFCRNRNHVCKWLQV